MAGEPGSFERKKDFDFEKRLNEEISVKITELKLSGESYDDCYVKEDQEIFKLLYDQFSRKLLQKLQKGISILESQDMILDLARLRIKIESKTKISNPIKIPEIREPLNTSLDANGASAVGQDSGIGISGNGNVAATGRGVAVGPGGDGVQITGNPAQVTVTVNTPSQISPAQGDPEVPQTPPAPPAPPDPPAPEDDRPTQPNQPHGPLLVEGQNRGLPPQLDVVQNLPPLPETPEIQNFRELYHRALRLRGNTLQNLLSRIPFVGRGGRLNWNNAQGVAMESNFAGDQGAQDLECLKNDYLNALRAQRETALADFAQTRRQQLETDGRYTPADIESQLRREVSGRLLGYLQNEEHRINDIIRAELSGPGHPQNDGQPNERGGHDRRGWFRPGLIDRVQGWMQSKTGRYTKFALGAALVGGTFVAPWLAGGLLAAKVGLRFTGGYFMAKSSLEGGWMGRGLGISQHGLVDHIHRNLGNNPTNAQILQTVQGLSEEEIERELARLRALQVQKGVDRVVAGVNGEQTRNIAQALLDRYNAFVVDRAHQILDRMTHQEGTQQETAARVFAQMVAQSARESNNAQAILTRDQVDAERRAKIARSMSAVVVAGGSIMLGNYLSHSIKTDDWIPFHEDTPPTPSQNLPPYFIDDRHQKTIEGLFDDTEGRSGSSPSLLENIDPGNGSTILVEKGNTITGLMESHARSIGINSQLADQLGDIRYHLGENGSLPRLPDLISPGSTLTFDSVDQNVLNGIKDLTPDQFKTQLADPQSAASKFMAQIYRGQGVGNTFNPNGTVWNYDLPREPWNHYGNGGGTSGNLNPNSAMAGSVPGSGGRSSVAGLMDSVNKPSASSANVPRATASGGNPFDDFFNGVNHPGSDYGAELKAATAPDNDPGRIINSEGSNKSGYSPKIKPESPQGDFYQKPLGSGTGLNEMTQNILPIERNIINQINNLPKDLDKLSPQQIDSYIRDLRRSDTRVMRAYYRGEFNPDISQRIRGRIGPVIQALERARAATSR